MKGILLIAQNTARELIRDKILYILLLFSVVLIGMGLLLSQLSVNQNLRLTADFGLSCILISSCIITIFIGSTLVYREIEKKTILFLMSYPIGRTQFLLGKFLGFAKILVVILFGLGTMLFLILYVTGWDDYAPFLFAIFGIFLEMLILLGFTIFLSTVMRPMLVVICSIGLFLIGHGMDGLYVIAHNGQNIFLQKISNTLVHVLPNFENMNWMNLVVYGERVSASKIFFASAYSVGWILFFLTLSVILFRRRDFV